MTTAYQGTTCTVAISPTNPRDLVVMVDSCGDACVLEHIDIYRSQDGGATLTPVSLPGGVQANGTGAAWIGSTLWLTLAGSGAFMVSHNGGPFRQIAINLPPPQSGAKVQSISQLVATRTALFASVMYAVPGSRPTTQEVQTPDDGATWATYTQPYTLLGTSADSSLLFGSRNSDQALVISRDAGATWTVPAPNPPQEDAQNAFAAPDGTLVATFSPGPNNSDQRIPVYRLRPGATTWTKILPDASLIPLAGLTVNPAGHPTALWSVVKNQTAYILLS